MGDTGGNLGGLLGAAMTLGFLGWGINKVEKAMKEEKPKKEKKLDTPNGGLN